MVDLWIPSVDEEIIEQAKQTKPKTSPHKCMPHIWKYVRLRPIHCCSDNCIINGFVRHWVTYSLRAIYDLYYTCKISQLRIQSNFHSSTASAFNLVLHMRWHCLFSCLIAAHVKNIHKFPEERNGNEEEKHHQVNRIEAFQK